MLERFKYPLFAGLILAIAGGAVVLLTYRPPPVVITILPPAPTATPAPIQVYVVGAVMTPNALVKVASDGRVADAVEAAGGLAPNADREQVNLARRLSDGEQVDIPTIVPTQAPIVVTVMSSSTPMIVYITPTSAPVPTSNAAATVSSPPDPATKDHPVNVNTADDRELQRLPGVGPVLAKAILEYRDKNGPSKALADLDKVSGIGEGRLAQWEGLIIFK